MQIFHDGDVAFESMFAAIKQAKSRVYLETYILKADRVGGTIIQLLAEAASRGCQVIVQYDTVGSYSLLASHLESLANHPNVHIIPFNPILHLPFFYSNKTASSIKDKSMRTHRKILICDDVGFAGGMNTRSVWHIMRAEQLCACEAASHLFMSMCWRSFCLVSSMLVLVLASTSSVTHICV